VSLIRNQDGVVYGQKLFQSAPSNQTGAAHFARIYLVASFLIAWLFWLLAWLHTKHYAIPIPLITLVIIGSFGPFLGAGVSTFLEGGLRETLHFYARALNLRMGWVVFLLSFFLMPIMSMGAELLHSRLMHVPFVVNMTWADLPVTYVFLFFLGGTLAEEYGWSYLSDKLDALLPLTPSVFTLGAIWALWHLPLFFIIAPGLVQAYTPFYMFFLCTVAMRFLFAWGYHKGRGSIMSNMLFHTATNLGYSVVVLAPSPQYPAHDKYWYFTIFCILIAVLLWTLAPIRRERVLPASMH
jgi:membrane protease YdiL (CAAX protease family)